MLRIAAATIIGCLLSLVISSATFGPPSSSPVQVGSVPRDGVIPKVDNPASLFIGNNSMQSQIAGVTGKATSELLQHLAVIFGIITETVQQIFEGICPMIFELINGLVYPLLDCGIHLVRGQNLICAASYQPCIKDLLIELASGKISRYAGILIKENQEENEAYNNIQAKIEEYLGFYEGEDTVFALMTHRFISLLIQVFLFLSVHFHIPPLVLCLEQRYAFGFDRVEVACPYSKDHSEGEWGSGGGGGGMLGGLIGGLVGGK